MNFWYNWDKLVVGAYLKLFGIRRDVSGLEGIPPGPKLIVANHPNATDSFHLPFLFREKLHFLVEYEALQTKIVGRWMQLADSIPVVAGRGKEALAAACDRLRRGNSVVIYPEAKLTTTHPVSRSGTGVARLALTARVPVLPIGFYVPIQNVNIFRGHSRDGRPKAGSWQTKGKCYIEIGEPMHVPEGPAGSEDYRYFRQFTDEIMEKVSTLAQQAQQRAGADSGFLHK